MTQMSVEGAKQLSDLPFTGPETAQSFFSRSNHTTSRTTKTQEHDEYFNQATFLLHESCESGDTRTVERVLSSGKADLNALIGGHRAYRTALHKASAYGHTNVVKLLLKVYPVIKFISISLQKILLYQWPRPQYPSLYLFSTTTITSTTNKTPHHIISATPLPPPLFCACHWYFSTIITTFIPQKPLVPPPCPILLLCTTRLSITHTICVNIHHYYPSYLCRSPSLKSHYLYHNSPVMGCQSPPFCFLFDTFNFCHLVRLVLMQTEPATFSVRPCMKLVWEATRQL